MSFNKDIDYPINILLTDIIDALKEEWISECQQLCQILQSPHVLELLKVVDCVARQLFAQKQSKIDHKLPFNQNNDNETVNKPSYILTRKRKLPKQKVINVIKSQEPLGVTVRFDNNTGDVVLARVLVGGAAYRSGLVNIGDRILEVNGIRLRGLSHLDVINILQKECMKTIISLKILSEKKIQESLSSSFMVKAHFNYDPKADVQIPCAKVGLPFDKGSILNVLNSSDPNWWQACKEIESANKSRMEVFQIAGLIPSKNLQERRIVSIRNMKNRFDNYRYVRLLNGFLPTPLLKSKWSVQKVKKIMYDLRDCIRYDREEICTYEPVTKYLPRPHCFRPIILIGPPGVGCSLLIRLLVNFKPIRYREPLAHTTRFKRFQENDGIEYHFISEELMNEEIRKGNFVCYSRYRGNYYGLHKQTIKKIIESGYVCIFKMEARFLRLVHTSEFKPYIIFIRPSFDIEKQIELYSQENVVNKLKSRSWLEYEMHLMIYEAHRLQFLYGHKFDSTIIRENIKETFENFLKIIVSVENEPSWIPSTWINKSNL